MNRQLGTKWFTFYTKVRPWFSCLGTLIIILDFLQYTETYLNNWWLLVYFLAAIAQPILCIMVAVKSSGDYVDFVRFVKGVLLFETIYFAYQQGVQQYIRNNFDIGLALVVFAIVFPLDYFVWYRLNVKYFEKRIIAATTNVASYESDTLQEASQSEQIKATSDADKIVFCRKCGEKLIENSQFCAKCGTQVVAVKNKPKAFVKCQICENSVEHVTYCEIKDDMGTRYRSLCDDCIAKYNAK